MPGVNLISGLGCSQQLVEGSNGELVRDVRHGRDQRELKEYTDRACEQIKELANKVRP